MEAPDRNKSTLTHVASATAAIWLDGLGCKPVETEVAVAGGWVADLASFWSPTMTEAKKSKLLDALVPKAVHLRSQEAFARMCRDVGGRLTVIVEVKTSRSDFLADAGRKYGTHGKGGARKPQTLPSEAHLQIVAGPASVFGEDHLDSWAQLTLSEDCKSVRKFDRAWSYHAVRPGQIEKLIAEIAIRRDHSTRYASMRRAMKAYRANGGYHGGLNPIRLQSLLREARAELRLWREMFPSALLRERLKREAAELAEAAERTI